MRRAVAAIAALAVTLGLFFLMQLLITGGEDRVPRPVAGGGVGLVTLVRDSASGAARGSEPGLLPPMPAPAVPPQPPSPPTPAVAKVTAPAEPVLTTDAPAFEVPVIDAVPYLGGPPVVVVEKPAAPAKPKVAEKTSSKTKSSKKATKRSKSRQAAAGRGSSAGSSAGSKASGAGRRSGGKSGAGSGGRGGGSSGDSDVVVLSRPKPDYPRKALRNKEEGWVKVSFTITEKGTVSNPKVVSAKPRRVFDRSALQAIRKWRFKPKTVGGRPVRTNATQLIEFNLASR